MSDWTFGSSYANVWHFVEFWYDGGTTNPVGAGNGIWLLYQDGVLVGTLNNIKTRSACSPSVLMISFYNCNDSRSPTSDRQQWWDEIYVDNTRARVVIGNAATLSASTHREIQIPTAWNSNGQSIGITVNLGSFANTTGLYLFVVDSTGRVSPGFAL